LRSKPKQRGVGLQNSQSFLVLVVAQSAPLVAGKSKGPYMLKTFVRFEYITKVKIENQRQNGHPFINKFCVSVLSFFVTIKMHPSQQYMDRGGGKVENLQFSWILYFLS